MDTPTPVPAHPAASGPRSGVDSASAAGGPEVPRAHGDGGPPPDLAPWEQEVAAWIALLGRADAPEGLRERLLAAIEAAETLPGPRAPSARWGLAVATAAGLLLALGIGAFSRAAATASQEARLTEPAPSRVVGRHGPITLVDDPSMPLFHDLESFGGPEPLGLDGPDGGR